MRAEAVLYVKHLERMRAFYASAIGLEVVVAEEGFCVLESDEWRLSLVVVPENIAMTIQIAAPARRRDATAIKLAFAVARIDDLRTSAIALGGRIDPVGTEWDFLGFRRCDGIDPEGNVIQVLESLG